MWNNSSGSRPEDLGSVLPKMWSGSAHTGDSYPNQWGMNSAAYMSMPHEQVDWASLAQQWIKMKEEGGSAGKSMCDSIMDSCKDDTNSNPPPPPTISGPNVPVNTPAPPWTSNQTDGVWNGSWGWEPNSNWWMGTTPPVDQKVPPAAPSYTAPPYTPLVEPTPPVTVEPAVFPFSTPAPAAPVPPQFPPSPQTYWPPSSTAAPPEIKEPPSWDHHRPSSRKHPPPQSEPPPELDAARRKQLPAWIREGLEKMEREKQKKAESERLAMEKKSEPSRPLWDTNPVDDSHVTSDLNGTNEIVTTVPSKFDSDSEDSDHAKAAMVDDDKSAANIKRPRFTLSERESSPPPPIPSPPPKPVFKSKEQIFESVMVDVRRILTQILMEVTDEEIRKCAEQAVHRAVQKAPAATIGRKSQALTSLTGKLGLGIYESESGTDEESDQEKVTNEAESDDEILNRIQRLQNDFASVEKNIDREAKEQEEREKRQLGKKEASGDESSDDAEEQVQPHSQGGSSENKTERRPAPPTHPDDKHHHPHHHHHHHHNEHHGDHEPIHSKNSGDSRDRSEERSLKDVSRSSRRSPERKSRRYSSGSSSNSSSSSRSSRSSYRRRKYKASVSSKYRYSRSKSRSRSRSRSRDTNHSRDSRRSSRRDRRHSDNCKKRRSADRRKHRRSSSSSSDGRRYKRSNHRRY